MEGANLNFNDMDFDLSFTSEYTQPAAQMQVQPFMKPAEDNTSDFFFAGDEGIDTSAGQFMGAGTTQQSFDSLTADLFPFPQETGFGLQQNLTLGNTMGPTSWNNQLSPAMNDFSHTTAHTQAFAPSLSQPQFGGSVQKRPLQLDTQDFPQPKRQERSEFTASFSPFAPSTSVTGSSWTVETQLTPTSSTEIGLSDEAADVCATWFAKYGMLPGDRHIESLSQLTEESPTAIRQWFGQMLKQGMSGHDSAYKSQTRLTQQDQLTSTSTGWMEANPTLPCNTEATATTTAAPSAPRGGKKGCTRTDKHELLCRDPNKIYQCTRKCGKRYGRKCDWKRNEEEGYPSKSWQCSLCVSQGVDKVKPCFRRYHFSQHFRNIHPGLNSADFEEDSVVHSGTTFPRKCGFCTHRFVSRQDRIDHIADHFKQGKCMLDWNDSDEYNDSDDMDDDDDRPDSDGFDSNSPSHSPQDKDSQGHPGQKRNGSGGNQQGGNRRQPPPTFSQFQTSDHNVSCLSPGNGMTALDIITQDITTQQHMMHGCTKSSKQHVTTARQHIKPQNNPSAEGRTQLSEDSIIEHQQPLEGSTSKQSSRGSSSSSLDSCPRSSVSGDNEAAGSHEDVVARDVVSVSDLVDAILCLPKRSTLPDLREDLQAICDRAKKPAASGLPVTDRVVQGSECPDYAQSTGGDRAISAYPLADQDFFTELDSLRPKLLHSKLRPEKCSSAASDHTPIGFALEGKYPHPLAHLPDDPPDDLPPRISTALENLERSLSVTARQTTSKLAEVSNSNTSGNSYWRDINENSLDVNHSWEQSFKSVKLLGAGGFSTVDEVVHRETNLRVSRKTLKNRDSSAKEELMKEVDVLQKLRHPHIVRFLGAYAKGDKVSVLLSPVAETTLAIWLETSIAKKPAGLAETVAKMYGCLSSTIRYLHEQRPVIKHMDIKPQNILVMYGDSDHPHVILSDFGISSSDSDPEGPHSKPVTRQYCAPEVPEDAVRGRAADIWSLGCVFLEMASAVLTQGNPHWQELRDEFRGNGSKCYWQDVPRLQEYLSDFVSHASVPQDFITLWTIQTMLSRDPAERPDAAQLTIIFTPGACCLKWPNEKVSYPGPVEELSTVEMLIREDSVDCLAQLDHCSGIELRHNPQSFGQAKSWLDECSHGHESCRRQTTQSKALPTRLVDTQPNGSPGSSVRVLTSSDIANEPWEGRVDYVVVNHLWNPTDMTLSSDRLSKGQGLLNKHALPEAVNDAIEAANRIGFRYIWLDSLCILQDSEQEKRRECVNMASVYRNAALTIVLDKINQKRVPSTSSDDSNSVSQDTSPLSDLPFIDWNTAGFSWDTRAWSLQERLLSHRLLHLAGEQMYWECNSLKASETFPRGLPPLIWEKVHTQTSVELIPRLQRNKHSEAQSQASRYCKKELKRQCDLTKHEMTHSQPWKCTENKRNHLSLGLPIEKERNTHVNDKHSSENNDNVKSKFQEAEDVKFEIHDAFPSDTASTNPTSIALNGLTPVSPRIHSLGSGCTDHKVLDIWGRMVNWDLMGAKIEDSAVNKPEEIDVVNGDVDVVMKIGDEVMDRVISGGDGKPTSGLNKVYDKPGCCSHHGG
ncbi:hypothetical protein BCR34DRAFT_563690 [Clohesyomyces aquaticus]|uniref:Protein kinase domain-containing protein n=1 Tax=Clohesyomyces aquaticus TaxID=1231657 RepID=A0A1Y1ZQ80_9PLEO|nr:hypothetical protein BCR34DRAFT_563690 [Clohesyomyces aquaticus]